MTGTTPPFSLLSVSFSQGGEGSEPVLLMCLLTLPALGDSCGLGGWGAETGWHLPWPGAPFATDVSIPGSPGRKAGVGDVSPGAEKC